MGYIYLDRTGGPGVLLTGMKADFSPEIERLQRPFRSVDEARAAAAREYGFSCERCHPFDSDISKSAVPPGA